MEYTTTAKRPKLIDHGPGLTLLDLGDIDVKLSGLAWIYGEGWEAMVTLNDGQATFSSICGGIQDR